MLVAICGDSACDIERIKEYTTQLTDYVIEYRFYYKPEEMLNAEADSEWKPDMYILDIEMSGMDGISVAKEIRSCDSKALIVFLTSYAKYMVDVFEVVTFDFISKPITYERFRRLLDKANTYLNVTDQSFSFIFRQCRYNLKFDEITYFEKSGRQVLIHTQNTIYKTNMNTGQLWEKLDKILFATAHSSYIVNLGHVRSVSYSEVEMKDGTKIPISRSHRKEFTRTYMDFIERSV